MEIVAALFVENLDFREVEGPSTRIDLTGVHFSFKPESYPITMTPHLLVLLREPADGTGGGTFEAVFIKDGDEIARNQQQVDVEPGKFNYRLVRPELDFDAPGTVEAHCRIVETDSAVMVPLTALP